MRFSYPPLKANFTPGLFICFFISLLLTNSGTLAQISLKADDICGEWWTPDNKGKMIFFRSEGKYFGMVSWLKYPNDPVDGKPRTDKHNPDPSLRNRTFIGLVLFSNFVFDTDKKKYTGGVVYDAGDSGKTYSCWLKLIESNVLEIHGYIGFSLIGKSEYFIRVLK